jgi:hypothetical protein
LSTSGGGQILVDVTPSSFRSSPGSDAIVGYRTFVAVVAAAYVTLIALTPRTDMMMTREISWAQLVPLSGLYLLLGIWGFDYARRRGSVPISLTYLLIEFAIGMHINTLAWSGSLPLILLPLAAQAVILLPRVLAAAMCVLVIAGVSGTLSWVPAWPHWLRNIAQATAAVVFVVVYGASRNVNVRRGSVLKRWPPKSHSSPPRTSATAWHAKSTTPSGIT